MDRLARGRPRREADEGTSDRRIWCIHAEDQSGYVDRFRDDLRVPIHWEMDGVGLSFSEDDHDHRGPILIPFSTVTGDFDDGTPAWAARRQVALDAIHGDCV